MDAELQSLIDRHISIVEQYRADWKGNNYDIVPVSVNVAIVDMIENKTINRATARLLLDYYFTMHKIRMGIETKEDVLWLIEFLKLNDKST